MNTKLFATQGVQKEYSVQFKPEFFNTLVVCRELYLVGNDLPTEMSEESSAAGGSD